MRKTKIGIIGLGYVGLPLAKAFSRVRSVVGYDINSHRVEKLKKGIDLTGELKKSELLESETLIFSDNLQDLKACSVYIITVPTPIDSNNDPDLQPLQKASEFVGQLLTKGDIVVYESTVYPGVTEDFCQPILEQSSGLKVNEDFGLGYSPERINPGDKVNKLERIIKVTSGSSDVYASIIDDLYREIIDVGTFKAASIKTAEAAKIIENTQRDVNIALMNEFSKIFRLLGVDTKDVLDAASTKWNFLNFQPGLVGGHCIGVDPYYLTYKSEQLGYRPNLILDSRLINNSMPHYVVDRIKDLIIKHKINTENIKAIVFGAAFKENCPDTRNSKTLEITSLLLELGIDVTIYDPIINELPSKYGRLTDDFDSILNSRFDILIFAVPHDEIVLMEKTKLLSVRSPNSLVIDLKSIFSSDTADFRL
jgi:UDP-N-acetyl-D-glucosamine/UDP-N-acetyl-D-galactosamine dehydrogenase